jgi:hypothetical protein
MSVSVSVVCCQVVASVTGRSLVQMSPTECIVSECDREAPITRRSWPTGNCNVMGKKNKFEVKTLPEGDQNVGNVLSAYMPTILLRLWGHEWYLLPVIFRCLVNVNLRTRLKLQCKCYSPFHLEVLIADVMLLHLRLAVGLGAFHKRKCAL